MKKNNLLEEIEQLRREMERRGPVLPLNSKEMLRLSVRLDRLINTYHKQASDVRRQIEDWHAFLNRDVKNNAKRPYESGMRAGYRPKGVAGKE